MWRLRKTKMTNSTIQSISNEWTSFAKANFYHEEYPEFQDFADITDAQWTTFGRIMSYIKEGTQFESPSGSGCRDYYRAYAHMITVGREGTKELIASVIDDTAHPFSIAYTMVQFLGYSELIFGRVNDKQPLPLFG